MRGASSRLIGASMAIACLLATADAGPVQTSYEYDVLGRLIRATQDDAASVEYTYDEAGNRTVVVQEAPAPPAPSFSVSNASVSEGGTLSFIVTKTGATTASHSVSYATANGTAVAGSDYTAKSGSLTFTASQSSKTVNVTTLEDSLVENDETMTLNLTSPTNGATISDSQGIGTIANDDLPNSPPVAANDSMSGSFTIPDTVTANVLANDSDPDNDPLTITSASCSTGGCSVSVSGGQLQVTGTTAGTKTVSYTISDGQGGTDSATLTVSEFVEPPNGPPNAVNDSLSGTWFVFGTVTANVLANDSDPDDDPLTITSATCTTTGCVAGLDGSSIWVVGTTPGTKQVTYTISDGQGGADSAVLTVIEFIQVPGCNDPICI